jgi:putative solute:sodium symporter small subunit
MPSATHRGSLWWRRTRRLTLLLLAIWFALTFIVIFYARELSKLVLFGWSLSFYLAAQGALLGYLALIGVYALCMRGIDRQARGERHDA